MIKPRMLVASCRGYRRQRRYRPGFEQLALRPVRSIRETARHISSTNLSERIPVGTVRDEISEWRCSQSDVRSAGGIVPADSPLHRRGVS